MVANDTTMYLNYSDPADEGDWSDIRQTTGPYADLAAALAAKAALPPTMEQVSITDGRGNSVHDDGTMARY